MVLQNTPVSEIMSSNVITVDMHQTLEEAKALFAKHKIRHLPVLAYGNLVGMLSLTDIQRLSSMLEGNSEAVDTMGIEQVMHVYPKYIKNGQSVRDVAELLSKDEYYALPVVGENNKLMGIVTTTDLIKLMLSK